MKKLIKKLLPLLIVIIIFLFLTKNLIMNWSKIPFDDLHFNMWFLIISLFALLVHFLSYSKSWQKIMCMLGSSISFTQSSWMISTTQIAKYLPGRIWYMVGRVYVGKKEKMSSKNLAVSMILETCLLIISSCIIFLLSVIMVGNYSFANLSICLILLVIAIIILNPHILSRVVNFLLQILKKPSIKITVSYSQILKLSIYFFGLWIAQIIGFYFVINAIYPMPISKIFTLSAAYTLSWMTGFVVIFAPGGLGVREGMMTLLLSPILPAPLAIAISFIARIWITLFEIVIFFVGLLVKRLSNLKDNSQ